MWQGSGFLICYCQGCGRTERAPACAGMTVVDFRCWADRLSVEEHIPAVIPQVATRLSGIQTCAPQYHVQESYWAKPVAITPFCN